MKTKVIMQATICIEIDQNWQDTATLKEIEKSAMTAANGKLSKIGETWKDIYISDLRHSRTHLVHGE
jgi:hypothetical protein